jgi:hypothetical protein
MKSGCCLLAVLALGAWSMDSAAAGHRSHGTHSVGAHPHFRAGSRNHAGTLAATPQTHGSEGGSAVTDHVIMDHPKRGGAKDGAPLAGTDKANGDEGRHQGSQPGKTGADRGVAGKPDADAAIDTRIPAYHGREADRIHKNHPPKTADDRTATGILKHPHVGTLYQQPQLRPSEQRYRNAVGVTLDHDKTGEHRNAVGVAVVPPASTAGVARKTDSAPLPPGAVVHDANEHPAGNTPANVSLPGAPQGSRGAVAPIVAATNGSGIAGTDMIRPVSRTTGIGGPARIASGIVSGNSIRLKHP